jgi:hypothetical protein
MWQDANVGARHGLLAPGISYEVYGKALSGVPIDITPAL